MQKAKSNCLFSVEALTIPKIYPKLFRQTDYRITNILLGSGNKHNMYDMQQTVNVAEQTSGSNVHRYR